MRVIYDIPRAPERLMPIPSLAGRAEGGDIDYGPDFWVEYIATFPETVAAETAAKNVGNYLARNYEDDFRQVEIIVADPPRLLDRWLVKVHLAWGDGHYTKISA